MWEWLTSWFDTEGFPARWHCGEWPEWLGWLHIVADLVTFAAYVAIPVVLGSFLVRRRDLPFPRVFALFAAFIFACGAVHFVEAMIFWQPMYYLSGLLKAGTAVVSVATVVVLVPTMRAALRLPGFQRDTARLATIVSASADAIVSQDLDGVIESWNLAAERMYGYSAAEMIGQPITRLVPEQRMDELAQLTRRAHGGERIGPIETVRIAKSGSRLNVSLSLSPVFGPAGSIVGVSAISRDVSLQRQQEQQLREATARLERANRRLQELADHDPLTGLRNRRGFDVVLANEVERMRRHGTRAAVVMIDLDDFKAINDRYGHGVGDEVLREIAGRIEDAARETDCVGRVGGDEFLVLAVAARLSEAMQLAERIRAAVAGSPVATSIGAIEMSVSCGVEAVDPKRSTLGVLVGASSAALRLAKGSGKNTVTVGDWHGVAGRVPSSDELRAVVQAIVALKTGEPVGYELLIRGPRGPLESPEALFRAHRAAEQLTATDLACLSRCLEQAAVMHHIQKLHVNLLPSTLLETEVEEIVARLLRLPRPSRLCLELNEAMLVGDPAALAPRTKHIREAIGCSLAIDDVGFGRSSLEALIVLEPDVIKLDRHVVQGIARDRGARRRLNRLVHVGRALGAEIIAEGVEEEDDRDELRSLGVQFAQGFLFGRPAEWN